MSSVTNSSFCSVPSVISIHELIPVPEEGELGQNVRIPEEGELGQNVRIPEEGELGHKVTTSLSGKIGRIALLVTAVGCVVLAFTLNPVTCGVAVGVTILSGAVAGGIIVERVVYYIRNRYSTPFATTNVEDQPNGQLDSQEPAHQEVTPTNQQRGGENTTSAQQKSLVSLVDWQLTQNNVEKRASLEDLKNQSLESLIEDADEQYYPWQGQFWQGELYHWIVSWFSEKKPSTEPSLE
jgi:hypothetical protein